MLAASSVFFDVFLKQSLVEVAASTCPHAQLCVLLNMYEKKEKHFLFVCDIYGLRVGNTGQGNCLRVRKQEEKSTK